MHSFMFITSLSLSLCTCLTLTVLLQLILNTEFWQCVGTFLRLLVSFTSANRCCITAKVTNECFPANVAFLDVPHIPVCIMMSDDCTISLTSTGFLVAFARAHVSDTSSIGFTSSFIPFKLLSTIYFMTSRQPWLTYLVQKFYGCHAVLHNWRFRFIWKWLNCCISSFFGQNFVHGV